MFPRTLLVFSAAAAIALPQAKTGGGTTTTGGGTTGTGTTGTTGIGTNPGIGTQPPATPRTPTTLDPNQNRMPDMRRVMYLSGKVRMDDGAPPPEPVSIERNCSGRIKTEGYSDSKGNFSIQLGANNGVLQDASQGSFGEDPFGSSRTSAGGAGGFGGASGGGIDERQLMGCEVRAVLPGFRSEAVPLSGRRSMDNPDIGTIILRRIAGVEGLTTSATTMMAPKDARKSWEKSRELVKKQKFADARKELEKAVAAYPKFAVAWQDLAQIQERDNENAAARESYAAALKADSKLVPPYIALAFMELREKKWEQAAEYSAKAAKLNPIQFPMAHFANAVANLNMGNFDEAEKSAREAKKADEKKTIPRIDQVLGVALAQKGDIPGAQEALKAYMAKLKDGDEKTAVMKQLAALDKELSAKRQNADAQQ